MRFSVKQYSITRYSIAISAAWLKNPAKDRVFFETGSARKPSVRSAKGTRWRLALWWKRWLNPPPSRGARAMVSTPHG